MKRIFLVFCLIGTLIFSASAQAKDSYFGIKGVISNVSAGSTPEDRFGEYTTVEESFTQSGIGFVFGKKYKSESAINFRLEFENTMRFGSKELDHYPNNIAMNSKVGFHNSTLINGYLDFPVNDVLIPYVGASAGLSLVSYDAVAVSSGGTIYTKKGLSGGGQLGLGGGVEFKISEKFSLDASARYLWALGHEIEFGDGAFKTKLDVDLADFAVGFRYYF